MSRLLISLEMTALAQGGSSGVLQLLIVPKPKTLKSKAEHLYWLRLQLKQNDDYKCSLSEGDLF